MKSINILLIISFCFILLISSSCSDEFINIFKQRDCSKCYDESPDYVKLKLEFSINNTYSKIPFKIYKGYAELSPVVYHDTAVKTFQYIELKVNQYYSIVAEYNDSNKNKNVYVVKEFYPKVFLDKEHCDNECYYTDDYVDLRIKNIPF